MEPVVLNAVETDMVLRYHHDAERIVGNMMTLIAQLIGWPENVSLEFMGLALKKGEPVVVFDTRTHEITEEGVVPKKEPQPET